MERGHDPVRREVSLPGHTAMTHDAKIVDRSSPDSWEKEKHGWVNARPALTSVHLQRKTNLGRSASLSEKELKEARTRSQIIAAQLTVPSNPNSKGVQLFNRRRQRVNAFTLVSVAGGQEGDLHECQNQPDSPSPSSLTWDTEYLTDSQSERRNNTTQVLQSTVTTHKRVNTMKGAGEVLREVQDIERSVLQHHFLPVKEKEEEIPEGLSGELGMAMKNDITNGGDSNTAVSVPIQEGEEEVKLNGAYKHPTNPLENESQSTESSGKGVHQSTITNRTARPFFSTAVVTLAGPSISTPDIPSTPSYSTPPLMTHYELPPSAYSGLQTPTQNQPHFAVSSRQMFSPQPPAPLNPTPLVPASMSLPPSFPSDPHPLSAMSPSPVPNYYAPSTPSYPTYVPQIVTERRSETPNRSGILDEGRARRSNRKSMFTFQEKPKLSPNPDLLSLVQRNDEMRRGRGQGEVQQEEEQMALGAEASNFLAKDDKAESKVKEAVMPDWASTLKSSQTQPRVEHKPEQALTNASGKGAELFAKRQHRMERYFHENADELRSPSPTTSLPPSWVYPSNMPGRVKAIINASNISVEISKTLQAQQDSQKKNFTARAPAPPPVVESPVLENGCSRIEMELSRHQPYQLNSSLFILNPPKDPISTLPKAAPPPKPVLMGSSYLRQTSFPSASLSAQYEPLDAYRSGHCFTPPTMPLGPGCSGVTSPVPGSAPEYVASPRSGVQAPKPNFSAKKAGIIQQVKEVSPATPPGMNANTPMPWTPNMSRRLSSSSDKAQSAIWIPESQRSSTVSSPLPRTILSPVTPSSTPRLISNSVPSSPPPRLIHKPITCYPTVKNHNSIASSSSPQLIKKPTCCSPTPRPYHDPVASCPVSQPIQSPIKSFQSPVSTNPLSRPPSNRTPTTPVSSPWESRCKSPSPLQDTKANHRLLAKNIINAAKRKNSPSPGALSGRGLPMSPVSSNIILPFESKPSSPFQPQSLSAQSPTFTSPPVTPTRIVRSPLRLYTTRSLTDSDASLESEDSGVRSPGVRSYNTCPRGWAGNLRLKRVGVSEDL